MPEYKENSELCNFGSYGACDFKVLRKKSFFSKRGPYSIKFSKSNLEEVCLNSSGPPVV